MSTRLLIILLIIVTLLFCIMQMRLNFYSDISVKPIISQDRKSNKSFNRLPVYLVSYADGPEIFFRNQNALALSSLNRGIDFIHNYRRSLLDPEFVNMNKAILNQKRGAGYWLWKPYIILKTLESMPENAVMIYADTGFVFRNHIQPLINYLNNRDIALVNWSNAPNFTIENISKHNALIKMDCDNLLCRKNPHIWAGFIILRNTPVARMFIKKWLDYCSDESIITDQQSDVKEYPEYNGHQHDEAILSILCYQNIKYINLITSAVLHDYAVWHHRHPGSEYKSLQPAINKNISGFERSIVNSKIMMWLRQFFITNQIARTSKQDHSEKKK